MSATPLAVRRTEKKPVHPIKLATRKALRELKDAGIDLGQSAGCHPGLYSLAQHDPELLRTVIQAVAAGDRKAKELWSALLGYPTYARDTPTGIISKYRMYLEHVPLVSPYVTRPGSADNTYWEQRRNMSDLRDCLPEGEHPDMHRLLPALDLYRKLYRACTQSSPYFRQFAVTKSNISDIIFVAENLEEIRRLQPALIEHKVWKPAMIKEIINAGTVSLSGGVL
jgi:hypothetical protein